MQNLQSTTSTTPVANIRLFSKFGRRCVDLVGDEWVTSLLRLWRGLFPAHMTAEERERMNSLCIRIQEEKDYPRFEALMQELNELVSRKERRFPQHGASGERQRRRPRKTFPAVVQKIVKSVDPDQVEKVEIVIPAADVLFREIRIENTLTDADGQRVALADGAQLDVTFEADANYSPLATLRE